MSIGLAQHSDRSIVKAITHTTIKEIYPHYYPDGAVAFFLDHHNDKSIANDISNNCVFLCRDPEHHIVGTVTIKKNEILRLFVLPQYQGKGYGRELLEFAETEIAKGFDEIIIILKGAIKKLTIIR